MLSIDSAQIVITAIALALIVFVLEMVRRRRLREDYSLLWLAMFGIVFFMSLTPRELLDNLASIVGISYSPSFYFVVGFVLLLFVMIQFSVVITKLSRENKHAAQHIAFLTLRLEQLEDQLTDGES